MAVRLGIEGLMISSAARPNPAPDPNPDEDPSGFVRFRVTVKWEEASRADAACARRLTGVEVGVGVGVGVRLGLNRTKATPYRTRSCRYHRRRCGGASLLGALIVTGSVDRKGTKWIVAKPCTQGSRMSVGAN